MQEHGWGTGEDYRKAASPRYSGRKGAGESRHMTTASPARRCELHLTLGAAEGEILRGFVREAALAEGVGAATASLIAGDGAAAWQALSRLATGGQLARVNMRVARQDVTLHLTLPGHARFAGLVASLGHDLPRGAGLSCREHGIDGWEISLHRSLVSAADFDTAGTQTIAETPAAVDDSSLVIDVAAEGDAPGIARCFLAVYGHHYVHPDVFSPHRYWARVARGEAIPVVARDGSGEVIGHVALEREAGAPVAERGEAVVLPQFRGHHLLERMTERLAKEAERHGLAGVYAEPLTIHTFSQRNDARAGMPVCAALLGANPEDFRPKDIACPTAGQRQSYLRTFRFVTPPTARRIAPCGPYDEVVRRLYDTLGVALAPADPASPATPESRTRIRVNDRGYGVIRFDQIGSACAIELDQALRDAEALGARSVQLSARIADPLVPQLITTARSTGFFFCGLGPGFAEGEDLLLLQRLTEPLDTAKLQLFSDDAKELVAFIDADRRAVAG